MTNKNEVDETNFALTDDELAEVNGGCDDTWGGNPEPMRESTPEELERMAENRRVLGRVVTWVVSPIAGFLTR